MDMYSAEERCGVKFPKKFRELYESGVMEWMEYQQKDYRAVYNKYSDIPSAFCYQLAADFEPFFFEKINEDYLSDYFSIFEKYDKKVLDKHYRLIPLGQVQNGDIYCLMYDDRCDDIKIVLLWHDGMAEVQLLGNDFDEFLYWVMLCAADWDEDINGDVWKAHLEYLTPEYREKLSGKTSDELKDEFESLTENMVDVFVDV